MSPFSCTCVLLRNCWTLSYVTWRLFHSERFPRFIPPPLFVIWYTKLLSGFAIGHPGQRRVPLLVWNTILIHCCILLDISCELRKFMYLLRSCWFIEKDSAARRWRWWFLNVPNFIHFDKGQIPNILCHGNENELYEHANVLEYFRIY